MPAQQQSRSLEVIVLAGRGLSKQVPAGARRKVQLTLVSSRDPDGDAFSAKVSPWTEAKDRGRHLRFGSSGLLCSFPLSMGRGAPSLVGDVRFAESAELRVRLICSSVATDSYVSRTAEQFLPTSLAAMATKEFDEATSQLEGEVRVPLTNILSGRVGFAADRALGGWMPLRRCLPDESNDEVGVDGLPPALWMQMYALPDHHEMVPALKAQLAAEVGRQPSPEEAPKQTKAAGVPKPAAPKPAALKPAASPPNPAPRWGPKAAAAQGVGQQQSGSLQDLIDVTLEETQESTSLPDVTTLDLLDVNTDSKACSLPVVDQGLPRVGGLLDGLTAAPQGPNEVSPLPRVGGLLDGLTAAPQGPNEGPSSFSFIQAGTAVSNDCSGVDAASNPVSGSAFGFIAGSSGSGQLDLAALYASSDKAPRADQGKDYSALWSFTDVTQGPGPSPGARSTPASNSLESLEQNLLADLGSGFKS